MSNPPRPADAVTIPPPPRRRGRTLRKLFIRTWLALAVLFILYVWNSYRATGFDQAILSTDSKVNVTDTSDSITFTPAHGAGGAGLIFIPGSLVDPAAYAPLARSVAEQGHAVVVLKLPFRCAPLAAQREAVVSRVRDTIRAGTAGTRWVVAGHSLGGALACRVARDPPDGVRGLVLIGTSHPRDFDLSGSTLDVTKVSASRDGLASPAEVEANAKNLPADTRWVLIEGGNHSQFGYYGFQLGDHRATTSRSDQQARTLRAILDALRRVNPKE
jgi:pimeloyl-ACP methyl ester carboxylesterase